MLKKKYYVLCTLKVLMILFSSVFFSTSKNDIYSLICKLNRSNKSQQLDIGGPFDCGNKFTLKKEGKETEEVV